MGKYRVSIKPSAIEELQAIDAAGDRARIARRIRDLAVVPCPSGCEKLAGSQHYRIRQGKYRIVYAVDDDESSVQVFKIGGASLP